MAMMKSLMKSFQKVARLHRHIAVTVPVPIARARENLTTGLSNEIILSGQYAVTRRYWGNLSHNRLKFHGPKDQYNRQVCFFLEGMVHDRDSETLFQGDLYIKRMTVVQTLVAIIVIFAVLSVMMGWSAIPVGLVFTGFIYGMTQWHCQYYAKEITQLLADLMLEGAPQSPS